MSHEILINPNEFETGALVAVCGETLQCFWAMQPLIDMAMERCCALRVCAVGQCNLKIVEYCEKKDYPRLVSILPKNATGPPGCIVSQLPRTEDIIKAMVMDCDYFVGFVSRYNQSSALTARGALCFMNDYFQDCDLTVEPQHLLKVIEHITLPFSQQIENVVNERESFP